MSLLIEALSKPIPLSHDIAPRIFPFIHKNVSIYGKKSFMWIGPTPRVIFTDPEMIKEIINDNIKYRVPETNPFFKLFIHGLAFLEGDMWTKHQRLLNPAFHAEKLKCMIPAFDFCSCEMIKKWQDMISEGRNSCEIDVWPSLQILMGDVISRIAFGSSYEEGRLIFELQVEQAKLAFQAVLSTYIRGSKFLPTKRNRRMKEIDRIVRFMLKAIIDKKKAAMKSGESSTDDFLGILLEANAKEVDHENKYIGMSTEEVIEECKLFYFAGQETTSTLLVWTMILLSMYPDWQHRAREEVHQVIGDDKVNVDHVNRLKIVSTSFLQVLRLYPPVPLLVRRKRDGVTLGNTTIQAKTDVALPTILIHHDQHLWGADAHEFNPERFSKGVLNATKGQAAAFFPFGIGPQNCIGQNLAMLEAKIAMALILKNFSFELSPSYTHAPIRIVTLHPQHGASLILHKI
ncbi:hypothetical protein DCAR_0933826 [Daucus carota subsp. sativus]|uniref:Cytochrome P450 n=1 Tax=Daucus carota subsp. sativus TaxID=79200 RepID=A0AAF0XVW4_DAUCS|nr:hypothetical protein DCAR_0933826 [Daucus carota subsp. sativus]